MTHLSTTFVNGEWEVRVRLCIGAGISGFETGADQPTYDFGIAVQGPAPMTSFAPASVVGQHTGAVLPGFILEDTGLLVAPPLPACNDANGLDGPYNCPHNTATSVLYYGSDDFSAPPFACTLSAAACGPAHQECNEITMRFAEPPNALRVVGVEGAGNPYAGCYPNPDMADLFGSDSDADGVFDSIDLCPGGNDQIDADGDGAPDCTWNVDTDGDDVADTADASLCSVAAPDEDGDNVPDTCDVCDGDVHNDSDGDGACDSADPCPFAAFAELDASGRCGTFDDCGIRAATAERRPAGWHLTTEICTPALATGGNISAGFSFTDDVLLAVYGAPNSIGAFTPAEFPLDDYTPAPGSIVTVTDPAFASNATACALYRRTGAPCAEAGDAPAVGLYYGFDQVALPQYGNSAPRGPLCRTVTMDLSARPERLHVFGLQGHGNLLGGCSLRPFAEITPTFIGTDDSDGDGVDDAADVCPGHDDVLDSDTDGVPDGCDACPLDFFNDSDGDASCDSADPCPLDGNNDADADGVCGDLEPGCELDADNDADGDGVCAPDDTCPLDPFNDADGDGLCADVDDFDTCSDLLDQDDDGTPDACDVCPLDLFNDSDGDGRCDSDDACPLDARDDSDGDGACDIDDPCPLDALDDEDGDGMCGDVDPCPAEVTNDADGDGLCEAVDNCPGIANADQANADGDAWGNACEPDADGDGVIDDVDNCALVANAAQTDADNDGAGDACDDQDDDDDGVDNAADACPATGAGDAVNRSGCSIAQTCSVNATWKNHGAYVSCVARAAVTLVAQRALTVQQAAQEVAAAARSGVGRR